MKVRMKRPSSVNRITRGAVGVITALNGLRLS